MYRGLYGLTGLENHVLAILRGNGMDIMPLYNNCWVSLSGIYLYFIYFGWINKLRQGGVKWMKTPHESAESLGIIKLENNEEPPEKAWDAIHGLRENEYILFPCSFAFSSSLSIEDTLPGKYYVYAAADDGGGIKLPNGPFCFVEEPIDRDTFDILYDGEYKKLTVNRQMTAADKETLWKSRSYKPEKYQNFHFLDGDFEEDADPCNPTKGSGDPSKGVLNNCNMWDVTFVLMQSLKQAAAYYGQYYDMSFIKDGLTEVTKTHNMFRRRYDAVDIPFLRCRELFYRLSEIEMEMLKIYKERYSEKKKADIRERRRLYAKRYRENKKNAGQQAAV